MSETIRYSMIHPSDRPIVVVDVEATGVDPHGVDRPWDVAVIRRDRDGSITIYQAIVQLPPALEERARATLPQNFRDDMARRYYPAIADGTAKTPEQVGRELVEGPLRPDAEGRYPIFAGLCPSYDAAMLAHLPGVHDPSRGRDPLPWHHELVDVGVLAAGWLGAVRFPVARADVEAGLDVSEPTDETRHTALGDARWTYEQLEALLRLAEPSCGGLAPSRGLAGPVAGGIVTGSMLTAAAVGMAVGSGMLAVLAGSGAGLAAFYGLGLATRRIWEVPQRP